MFDIGWTELMMIGIVALIVVGPKDLPVMFRTLGKFTARLRGMARDFTRAMEEAADEAGVKDVAKDMRKMTNPKAMGMDALKDAAGFDSFDPFGEDDEVADEDSARPAKGTRTGGGPETDALSEERAEAARKIRESSAAKATARLEAEAAAKAAAEAPSAPAPSADSPDKT
ncbi:sec-independent protein translocase protein TatB [Aliiruegeria haliotis]|uniref:Sec-independent protein translocase protein TatB n=1 Tax=Aliiruegeria haliotis TaxID=1280846 RepID=A0A2T0RYI0_9RHOB|nr:Sec-independent protein translocase protein TatB [Aliiruegeria haliotis]PRY26235.1 sec-independent protein translocase protein TatB [Aliiruegeria haliotis]